MGMGQSTPRRITVRNDEPRIIQVSEDVIRRLSSSRTIEATIESPQPIKSANVLPESNYTAAKTPPKQQTIESSTSTPPVLYREPTATKAEVLAAEQQFRQQLEKLEQSAPKKKPNSCQDASAKVAECYSNHPTQPLRCSAAVKEFAQCAYRVPLVAS